MPILNHLGLTVANLDASVSFYRDVVGMELVSRREAKVMGQWYDTLTENEGAEVASAHLRIGDVTLQLLEYVAAGAEPAKLGHAVPGSPHLCIGIDGDLDARHSELATAGYRVGPVVEPDRLGFRSFYVTDPDGVPVELLKRLA